MISLANEKIFGTRGLYYKGGIEIRPLDFLELRFGYLAGPSLWSARYGVGLLGEGITLQYAAYPQHITHRLFQQLSVSVNF